jgi:DNA-binding transcriptional LysR family regulator
MSPNFELRELRAFLVVAEEENLGRAANRLNISASPLSRQIRSLEARLDIPLFDHSKKRLKLLSAGREFAQEARRLLTHASELQSRAHEIKEGRNQPLRIGYVSAAMASGLLAEAIMCMKAEIGDVPIQLYTMPSSEQVEALHRGAIDIGFIHTAPDHQQELTVTLIDNDPFSLVVPTVKPPMEVLTPEYLGTETWIALDENRSPKFRYQFLMACRAFGFEPKIRYQAPDISSTLGLVESGLGIGILQSRLSRISPPGVKFQMLQGFPLSVQVHAVYRTGVLSEVGKKLLSAFPFKSKKEDD